MKTPLHDDAAIIRAMLQEHWQLTVSNIHFIPFGESAYSYRVETDAHTSYYLKIADRQTSVGIKTAACMGFSLPIQHFVAEYGLAQVTAPLPQLTIQGAYYASHGSLLFALYTFIDGETLVNAYPMSPDLVRQIGQALAALHTIQLPAEFQQHPPQDSLTAPFDAHLQDDLASLATISSQDAPYLQRLYEIVWPRCEEVRAFLAHSQEYEQRARLPQTEIRPVLCHGDPWGGNMTLSPDERFTFLDWEATMIAPPERDAFFYLNAPGPNFGAFIAGYQAVCPHSVHWHADLLIYYAYRIQLRNLAQWLHNLLHEPLDEGQREHDLKMLGFHCLERFAGVERMAQELPAALIL